MKYILAAAAIATLAACGEALEGNLNLTGDAGVNVTESIAQCQFRQNNGYIFVRQTGGTPYVFSYDWTIAYPDQWLTLAEADALRVTPLTPVEEAVIANPDL